MPKKSHVLLSLAAAAVVAVPIAVATSASAGEKAPEPALKLVAATQTVNYDRYGDDPTVWLDLGAHVVAGASPFELAISRASYHDPIVAKQVIVKNGVKTTKTLPKGLVTNFSGLSKFLHVTIADSAGKKLVERDDTFCPNGNGNRSRPDAPATSQYPQVCGRLPFALASVWGLQKGWSINTAGFDFESAPLELPDGTYNVTASVNKPHRDAFGIPANKSSITVKLVVRTLEDPGGPSPTGSPAPTGTPSPTSAATAHGHHASGHHGTVAGQSGPRDTRPKGFANKPAKSRPVGKAAVPAQGPRPDLRAVPAWQIYLGGAPDGPGGGFVKGAPEYLSFSANVWNAGPSPLVVDGFRRSGTDLMDAYQYFYDANGKQTGWAPSGTMEWDPREGHTHWHFTDFATYRLLDSTKKVAVRSGKEAFCLAPTDPVNLNVKGANWKPSSTDLSTACGGITALAVRQALEVGWGDTYSQSLPGQSFDVTGVPNGTYYIEVKANPVKRLFESDFNNNTSLRKVILGGKPGARTVTVPPYELIDAP